MLDMRRVLTLADVAIVLGVSRSTVARWARAKQNPLPTRRANLREFVVDPDALVAWSAAKELTLLRDPHELARTWPRASA